MPYDTTNGSLNNKIALPNKLYEAMNFQVPIITSKDTYVGELVEYFNIGIAIKCCDTKEIKNSLEVIDFQTIYKNFGSLNRELYLADNDYKNLEKFVMGNKG